MGADIIKSMNITLNEHYTDTHPPTHKHTDIYINRAVIQSSLNDSIKSLRRSGTSGQWFFFFPNCTHANIHTNTRANSLSHTHKHTHTNRTLSWCFYRCFFFFSCNRRKDRAGNDQTPDWESLKSLSFSSRKQLETGQRSAEKWWKNNTTRNTA